MKKDIKLTDIFYNFKNHFLLFEIGLLSYFYCHPFDFKVTVSSNLPNLLGTYASLIKEPLKIITINQIKIRK
jgi:hypothetical protein